MQINPAELKILFRGQGPKEVHPILSVSKQLSAAAEAARPTTRLISAEAFEAQADKGMTNSIGMKLVPKGAVSDPTGPKEDYSRMIRGGAWLTDAVISKSGNRAFHFPPETRSDYVGFRVTLSSPEIPK